MLDVDLSTTIYMIDFTWYNHVSQNMGVRGRKRAGTWVEVIH